MPFKSVEIVTKAYFSELTTKEKINYLQENRKPLVFKGFDIGPCVEKWTVDHLKSVNPDKKVKVHRSSDSRLDFLKKNFTYETITFLQLIQNCNNENKLNDLSQNHKEQNSEFWYLRSLGEDPRGRDVSDLSIHFPELFADLTIPRLFDHSLIFSSVFRISSPSLQLWTHYDTCDNLLVQVRGRKRIVFFPPSEALNLYLQGDKSLVIDIDNPDREIYPKFPTTQGFEVILEEGEILFIPALWFHNVTAIDFCVSVNVFWKNLDKQLYDKKDTYGNRDLIPAQLGFRTLEKAASHLEILPSQFEDFYLRRMIAVLEKRIEKLGNSNLQSQ